MVANMYTYYNISYYVIVKVPDHKCYYFGIGPANETMKFFQLGFLVGMH